MDTGQIITVVISLVGVLTVGLLVPIFLLSRTEKHRQEDIDRADRLHREDRDAEWARQDAVAAKAAKAAEDLSANQKKIADQAAEAASLLLAKQQETVQAQQDVASQAAVAAELLLANNERVASTQRETNGKLDVIHTLVNSSMTAAMQSEYDAVQRELAMMHEVIELKRADGLQPGKTALAAISATETKLHELDAALADRAKAQAKVNQRGDPQSTVTTTTTVRGAGGEA